MPSAEERFDQASDNTRAFLEEKVQTCSSDERVNRTEFYGAYKSWCDAHRFRPVTAHQFYDSVWDVFRIETFMTTGRRLFKARPVLDTGASGFSVKRPKTGAVRAEAGADRAGIEQA